MIIIYVPLSRSIHDNYAVLNSDDIFSKNSINGIYYYYYYFVEYNVRIQSQRVIGHSNWRKANTVKSLVLVDFNLFTYIMNGVYVFLHINYIRNVLKVCCLIIPYTLIKFPSSNLRAIELPMLCHTST